MARCDNCLANKVCDHNRFGFENCGSYISAADVAPKSEVAREIFEEIYKLVASKIPPHIRLIFKDDRNFEDGYRDGKTDALIEVLVLIAELKKRNTRRILPKIGVNVFFSREAAEAAGKEMEGGERNELL